MRSLLRPAAVLAAVTLLGCAAAAPQPADPAGTRAAPAGTAQAQAQAGTAQAKAPMRVLILKFYADWCPVCRRLKQRFADVEHRFATAPVKFVVFDFTNNTTTAAAARLAHALEVTSVYGRFAPATGFLVLVDARTRRLVSVLVATQTQAHWIAAIRSAIASDRAGS